MVKDLNFFEGLGSDSIVQRRNYKILIETESETIDFGNFVDKINLEFQNNVTKQTTTKNNITIIEAKSFSQDILIARSIYENSIEKDFIVSDSEYDSFVQYLSNKKYSYKTKTEEALDNLKELAIEEHYFESLNDEYEALTVQLADNKGDDLFTHKEEIKEILTGEIRSRYYYQLGRIEAALNFDTEIRQAIEILQNTK